MKIWLLLFILFLLPLPSWGRESRITFKKGSIEGEVTGHLTGIHDEVCYLAGARSGQHMRVEISADGATRGTVKAPSGEGEGQPGGLIFDDDLTESGDYRICVKESQMGDSWNGKFLLKVTIK